MRVPELHVGRGTGVGGVTVFPVWTGVPPLRGIDTGVGARVAVGELASGAEVERLSVTNLGARPALLLEGELLEGGRQTRALAYDVLVAAGETAVVEVACVEEHRWHGAEEHARRGRGVGASVKRRLRGDAWSRQERVWSRVAAYEQVNGVTVSGSLADHLDRVPSSGGAVEALPGQTGVIVGVGGWPVALELFGSRAALAEHLVSIIDAAFLEAMLATVEAEVPARRARRFAAALSGMDLHPRIDDRPGGVRVDVETPGIHAAGVATERGAVAHLSALNLRHELIGALA